MRLSNHLQRRTRLDQIAGVLAGDDNASFRRVARAVTTMNQESGASTHVVGRGRGQLVAVWHSLERHHIAQSVRASGKGTNILLASARRIVAARARLATAGRSSVNPRSIIPSTGETMGADIVSVRASSGNVQFR